MKFIIAYGKDEFRVIDGKMVHAFISYSEIARAHTLEEALDLRAVAGDLVFNASTGEIVNDSRWLFDWEKQQESGYAKRAMQRKMRLTFPPSKGAFD